MAVYEEMLTRYSTDGVEVETEVLPLCKYREVDQVAPLLTAWLGQLREIARRAEQEQGLRKRVYVRIPGNPEAWESIGLEVGKWIREELVDGLICGASDPEVMDQHLDVSKAVQLTRGKSCRVLVECGTTLNKQLEKKPTSKMIWAAAANAYHQGADGFGIKDMIRCQGMHFLDDMPGTMRLLRSPELLATADKRYLVRDQPKNANNHGAGLPGTTPALPRELIEGKPEDFELLMADDLSHYHSLGRVNQVVLAVRIGNLEPPLNHVVIALNGCPLPDSMVRITDLNYRWVKYGVAYQGSQIYGYQLTPEYYPKQGVNRVTVTLKKKDPAVDMVFAVQDIDCSVDYLLHRHYPDQPTQY